MHNTRGFFGRLLAEHCFEQGVERLHELAVVVASLSMSSIPQGERTVCVNVPCIKHGGICEPGVDGRSFTQGGWEKVISCNETCRPTSSSSKACSKQRIGSRPPMLGRLIDPEKSD